MPLSQYKERCKTIYLESPEQLARWESAAIDSKMNFNRWLRAIVEDYLNRDPDDESSCASRDIQILHSEVIKLRKELERSKLEMQQKETELFKLRTQVLQQEAGRIELDSKLLEVLNDGCVWSNSDLLEALDVDSRDVEAISAMTKLLQRLQDVGFVKEGKRGWKWNK